MGEEGEIELKIYIVRHGQTNSNLKRVYDEIASDEDINENGIEQAKEVSEKIKNIDFDAIYCSPLLRARHTAEIINTKKKEIIIDDRLRERNPGSLSGKPLEIISREEYWNYYTTVRFGTEETIESLFDRVKSLIQELKDKDYEKVLIVMHSGVSKAFYAYFNGIPEDGKFLKLGLQNGEIKEYTL